MRTFYTAALVLLAAGCATAIPPKELLDARAADKRASEGVAARLNPADLHNAKTSLQEAERAFADKGDTQEARDLSYTADLRFQTAESRARALETNADKARTIAQMQANIAANGQRANANLGRANEQIANQGQALKNQGQMLQDETQRRLEAEKRAAQSAADLARLGAVKNEPRGMVLTLSGGVLFVTNKAELLPAAQVKLNEVADALIKQDPTSKIMVEGYTDSQGAAAYNQELSQRRAKAVRDYLVSRGIASDRISSEGFGLTKPVADNGSAEGRANNRRVEIVITPAKP
ncbi:MAG: OmpA family protein [Deltaproteobacteria bacterium]|nr:OmpA family protein [Deltaproteobacteria bacterium]